MRPRDLLGLAVYVVVGAIFLGFYASAPRCPAGSFHMLQYFGWHCVLETARLP